MNVPKRFPAARIVTIALAAAGFLTGCRHTPAKPVIIWTDRAELAPYIEVFNTREARAKAVIVYKPRLAGSLPPAKGVTPPDIVIGSWLKNSRIKKNFTPVDYLFSEQELNPASFYRPLLTYGTANDRQYLLPVSFNLPAVIFSDKNKALVTGSTMLSTDEIEKDAASFNTQSVKGIYSAMGFAPSWNPAFLYVMAKMRNTAFREKGATFTWNQAELTDTVTYLTQWTKNANSSTTAEQDFAFKYLYTPDYKQVTSGRCLFAYTTSGKLFDTDPGQLTDISFRWIDQNGKIPVEDDIVTLGLYRGSKNTDDAETFITWFLNEETQKTLLDRSMGMHLGSATFGIAGGFSSIKRVNERVFPTYYRHILGNLPETDALDPPTALPPRWPSLKDRAVIPYLVDATKTDSGKPFKSLDDEIAGWIKQFNY
jgi:hypothetical protein